MNEAPIRLWAAPGGGSHWKVYRGPAFLGWVHRLDYRRWQAKGPSGAVVGGTFPNRREAVEALDVEAGVLADADPAGLAAARYPAGMAGSDARPGDDLRPGPAGPVRPDAPAEQPGPDRGPGPLPDADALDPESLPNLGFHPEPIPNIVLHPGDTIALADLHPDPRAVPVRLLDRDGNVYAVLDCEWADPGFCVLAIRFVGGRGAPVRPEPVAEPVTHSLSLPVGDAVTRITGPLYGPYEYTVTHRHWHTHASTDGRPDGEPAHTHDHEHAGTAAAGANAFGHGDDLHVHAH